MTAVRQTADAIDTAPTTTGQRFVVRVVPGVASALSSTELIGVCGLAGTGGPISTL
jgi:hypothetical protein